MENNTDKTGSLSIYKAASVSSKKRTVDISVGENVSFRDLHLSREVELGLQQNGFTIPSPIQLEGIPIGRCGVDMVMQAKSGTGKTCVFCVLALELVEVSAKHLQVLVLAPTREIADQTRGVITQVASVAMPNLECNMFIGGREVAQDRLDAKRCQIAVGTPGRVKQMLDEGWMETSNVRLLVLDEADEMLKSGEMCEDVNEIYHHLPEYKQMVAASATYPSHIANTLERYMKNPIHIRLDADQPALLGIKQYYQVALKSPPTSSSYSVQDKVFIAKFNKLKTLLSAISFNQCLVFVNYQTKAERLSNELNRCSWPALYISSLRAQDDRLDTIHQLQKGSCTILVSTDLTARGIDAKDIDIVVNFDVPSNSDTYYHRIGRAGRYGSFGAAITIVGEGKEMDSLMDIATSCNLSIHLLPHNNIPVNLPINMNYWNECEDICGDVMLQFRHEKTLEQEGDRLKVNVNKLLSVQKQLEFQALTGEIDKLWSHLVLCNVRSEIPKFSPVETVNILENNEVDVSNINGKYEETEKHLHGLINEVLSNNEKLVFSTLDKEQNNDLVTEEVKIPKPRRDVLNSDFKNQIEMTGTVDPLFDKMSAYIDFLDEYLLI